MSSSVLINSTVANGGRVWSHSELCASPLSVSPGSTQIRDTLHRDRLVEPFQKLGATRTIIKIN